MRAIRKLLARWTAFSAMARVLEQRGVANDVFMPVSRTILLIDPPVRADLGFDDMVSIVYRSRPVREAVVLQLANIAAFWRCSSELAVTLRDREEAEQFESIATDSAVELATSWFCGDAAGWVRGLVTARALEERTHHPAFVPAEWRKPQKDAAA